MAVSGNVLFIIVLHCVEVRREPNDHDHPSPDGLKPAIDLDSYAGTNRFRFNGYHLSPLQAGSTPSRCPHSLEICCYRLKPTTDIPSRHADQSARDG